MTGRCSLQSLLFTTPFSLQPQSGTSFFNWAIALLPTSDETREKPTGSGRPRPPAKDSAVELGEGLAQVEYKEASKQQATSKQRQVLDSGGRRSVSQHSWTSAGTGSAFFVRSPHSFQGGLWSNSSQQGPISLTSPRSLPCKSSFRSKMGAQRSRW
ncbi:hypothetical protein BJ742DRAFT_831415 [Cladochytrium replicatum]|nr:hypothetical protein BJ742DRAFT_831415 [Cladochytrium replicatum]